LRVKTAGRRQTPVYPVGAALAREIHCTRWRSLRAVQCATTGAIGQVVYHAPIGVLRDHFDCIAACGKIGGTEELLIVDVTGIVLTKDPL